MTHINTLEYFDNLVAAGTSPDEARAHVNMLDKSFDSIVTKDMLRSELKHLERDLKFFFIKTIAATLFAMLAAPKVIHLLGWS